MSTQIHDEVLDESQNLHVTGASPVLLKGFKISHTVDDKQIRFEAENQQTFKIYTAKLTNQDIIRQSSNLIISAHDLADDFMIMLEGNDPLLKVDINEEAILKFSITAKIGSKARTVEFDVPLLEEKCEALDVSKRLFKKISEDKYYLEKYDKELFTVIEKLIEHNINTQKRMEDCQTALASAIQEIKTSKQNESVIQTALEEAKTQQRKAKKSEIQIQGQLKEAQATIELLKKKETETQAQLSESQVLLKRLEEKLAPEKSQEN